MALSCPKHCLNGQGESITLHSHSELMCHELKGDTQIKTMKPTILLYRCPPLPLL